MRFSKVIVLNPPNPPRYVSNKDSMGGFGQLYPKGAPPFPPLDLPYLAASLSEARIVTEVVEAGALDLAPAQVCARFAADRTIGQTLVAVRTSLPTIDWDLEVCAQIQRQAAPAAIAVFGPAVSSLRRRIERDTCLAFIVQGEPDGTLAQLAGGAPLPEITGLIYRDGGRWSENPQRPFERDLDSLPFPRWDMLPIDRYVIPKSSTSGRVRFLPMLTSRGCPYGCSYCPYPVGQGLRWRVRSPKNVVDEMGALVGRFGVQHILFRDPMFSLDQKRVVAICDEIVARGLKVGWKCETRVDCLDEATIAAMARAGCTGINFGVESIDPEVQKGVHRKPILVAEFVQKVKLCRKHNISTFAFFVVGLPGDTLETILPSIAFAVGIRANWTQFTVATPFIGTPMHDWAAERGFIAPDFYRILNAHTMSAGNEHLRAGDIERLHRFARLVQELLLNRKGLLKNELRTNEAYRIVKAVADTLTYGLATIVVRAGSWYFRRSITPRPSMPSVDAARPHPLRVLDPS